MEHGGALELGWDLKQVESISVLSNWKEHILLIQVGNSSGVGFGVDGTISRDGGKALGSLPSPSLQGGRGDLEKYITHFAI